MDFEEYWKINQKRLIRESRYYDEYRQSAQGRTPLDWIALLVPIAVGILAESFLPISSEILRWGAVALIIIVLMTLMELLKNAILHRRPAWEILEDIKKEAKNSFHQ